MNKVLIVDGYNLFIRHYAAHPAMSSNGEQIGGFVGFFYSVVNLIEKFKPSEVIVVWEGGGSHKKRSIDSNYKKGSRPQRLNRYYEDIPDTMRNRDYQIKLIVKMFSFTPIKQIYVSDCEADDAIGFICRYLRKEDLKLILSSDHDFYQLIDEKTRIWSPTLKKLVQTKDVIERYGIHPNNFCLAKAVVGDNSDNIKGVKGVGFKSLSNNYEKFIDETDYSMESFFEDTLMKTHQSKKKLFNNILVNETLIKRNWRLAYLDVQNLSHVQVEKLKYKIENSDLNFDKISATRLLLEQGINNLHIDRGFINFKLLKSKN